MEIHSVIKCPISNEEGRKLYEECQGWDTRSANAVPMNKQLYTFSRVKMRM